MGWRSLLVAVRAWWGKLFRRGGAPGPRTRTPAGRCGRVPHRRPRRNRTERWLGRCRAVRRCDPLRPQPDAAYRDIRRILASGGRVALTCWEPVKPGDERLPERLRHVDVRAGLTAGGFGNIEVGDRPGWPARERAMREEAAALDPGDDPALRSFSRRGRTFPRDLRPAPPGHGSRDRTLVHCRC
jgi:hypothetical protein